jgi:hypothetical protein
MTGRYFCFTALAQGLYVISLGIFLSFVISGVSLCTCFFCCKGLFRRQASPVNEFVDYELDPVGSRPPSNAGYSTYVYQDPYQYDDWNPEEVQRLFALSHPGSPAPNYNTGPTEEERRAAAYYEKFGK